MLKVWKLGKVFVLSAAMFSAGVVTATVALSYLPKVSAAPELVAGGVKQLETGGVFEGDGVRWELQGCQRVNQKVTCNFLITSSVNGGLAIVKNISRVIDSSGNEYQAKGIQIGRGGSDVVLAVGVPIKGSITFELPREVTRLALVEMPVYNYPRVQFRNIDIGISQASNPTNTDNNCVCPRQKPKKPLRYQSR